MSGEVIDKLVSAGDAISHCVEQTQATCAKLLDNSMQSEMKNVSQARDATHRLHLLRRGEPAFDGCPRAPATSSAGS